MKKTRKHISLLLSVLLMLTLFAPLAVIAAAEDAEEPVAIVGTGDCGAEGSDVKYTLYSDGRLVIRGSGEIKDDAFYGNRTAKILIIEEGITRIGTRAFGICTQLEKVILPDSLERIGSWAFYSCMSLTSIGGGNHIKVLEQGALSYNNNLKKYRIPDSVESIEDCVFLFDYSQTEEVVFGTGIQSLDRHLVQDHGRTITKVTFLNKNTEIPSGPFNYFPGFDTQLPAIYSYAGGAVEEYANQYGHPFYDLAALHADKDCIWDEGTISRFPTCTRAGEMTYYCKIDPSHIHTEEIPAFGLNWTIVENSTETSRGLATAVCTKDPTYVKNLVIPARGTAVEVGYCGTGLNEAYYVLYEDGTLFVFGEGAIKGFSFMGRRDVKRLVIDNGITAIGDSAFAFLLLETIDFGSTLETIGDGAFYDSDGFEEIILPESVKTVEAGAFALCSDLKRIVFGTQVETVGDWALLQCYELEQSVFLNRDTIIVEEEHPAPVQEGAYHNLLRTIHGGTVYGYAGGSVEAYANEKGLRFVPLDADDIPWIILPYTTDGLSEGDWYLDIDAFMDLIGRGKSNEEKARVRELIEQHVVFSYNPGGDQYVYKYEFTNLPAEDGTPDSGTVVLPLDLILESEDVFPYDYNALQQCVKQYTASSEPDTPQQPQEEENWFQQHIVGPLKSVIATILSFFRRLFKII